MYLIPFLLGHGRVRKSRHREGRKFKATRRFASFDPDWLNNESWRSMVCEWALDLLPLLLGRSAVSSEMTDVLRGCTFAMIGIEFLRKMKVAKVFMRRYILRVESAVGDH